MTTHWGYGKSNGPSTWKENCPAAGGDRQSPVDINPVHTKPFHPVHRLSWKYIPKNTEKVKNNGHSWEAEVDGKGSELSGGPLEEKYILEQFHCHWGSTNDHGSEHTVNGKPYAGELHLVHRNSKYSSIQEACKHPDGLCVLGIFLKPGKLHYELNKIVAILPNVQYKNEVAKVEVPIDPGSFIPQCSEYWTYPGSLTTPPCCECVIWIVFQEPIEVSNEQLSAFRCLKTYCAGDKHNDVEGCIKDNFRPTAPLGKREIRRCSQ